MKVDNSVGSGVSLPGSGCILYYPFVEGSGTTVHDFSKNGIDATISGGTWDTTPSEVSGLGYGVSLDGADDYIAIPDDAALDTGGPLSCRLRFKTPTWGNGSTETYITRGESGNIVWRIRKKDNEKLTTPAGNINPVTDLHPDTIHEIVFAVDSNRAWVALNGSVVFDGSGGSVSNDTIGIDIGTNFDRSSFTEMTVYSLELYDRILGLEEIRGDYHPGWSQFGGVGGQTRWYDSSWAGQMTMDPENNEILLSSSGARMFVDGNGEIVVEDEAGNQTTIS